MDYQDGYKRKLISAEQAAGMVKSGDRIIMPPMGDPPTITAALAARRAELRGVEVTLGGVPYHDAGWYSPGWEESFPLNVVFAGSLARRMLDHRRASFTPSIFSLFMKPERDDWPERKPWDYLLEVVSPPDPNGYCSFGHQIWWRKHARSACRTIIAEVDANQIRTYGENYIHISEIDYLVEHNSPRSEPIHGLEINEYARPISEYISTLVKDGDTIQLGAGTGTDGLAVMGTFDEKHDLGIHAEITNSGIAELVRKGIITGKRKTINPGKVVATCLWPEPGGLEFYHNNPMFELYDVAYTNDVKVIAAHDNMVAINTALMIDLTGQIVAEAIGPRIWSAPGGQLEFAIGALSSKGGRYIVALPSCVRTKEGLRSRIVPQLPQGSYITVPRTLTDIVVTEYGIARLLRKSHRERAQELIAIAHPDFRAELKKEAEKLFWP